ncbi:isoprenoid synthase domain-containing protein [Mycena vulgaris]|nr:isoprenoid synthase domain-containing protein [Mycena vulgaris]
MSTMVTEFPPARQHRCVDDLTEANDLFFLEAWPFSSPAEQDAFVKCNYGACVAKNIPDGCYEKMVWACRVNALLFLTDNFIEPLPSSESKSHFVQRILGIITGKTVPKAGNAMEEVTNLVYHGIETTTSIEQYRQFCRLTCIFYRVQDAPRRHITNVADFMAFRRLDCGDSYFLAVCRYALDLYVPDEQLENPMLVLCETLTLDCVTMEKDVVSYAKEVQHGTLGANHVALLLEHGAEGRVFSSAAPAQEYIREQITEHETRLHDAITAALTYRGPGILDDSARKWIPALPYFVSRNMWWSQTTARYNIPGHPAPRKIIHLEGVGDITEPCEKV